MREEVLSSWLGEAGGAERNEERRRRGEFSLEPSTFHLGTKGSSEVTCSSAFHCCNVKKGGQPLGLNFREVKLGNLPSLPPPPLPQKVKVTRKGGGGNPRNGKRVGGKKK